jgi:bifunctional DNA-binding transcriptional regulator/antitoxin component of YhaV-PrlF toxin-antitoxin module
MTNESPQSWTVSVDEEGVLTFPDELLEKMGWKEDDVIEWLEEPDGSIILKKCEQPDELNDESTTSTIDVRND